MSRRRALAAALAASAVLTVLPALTWAADVGEGTISASERLPVFRPDNANGSVSSNGSLLLDTRRRIGYQVYSLTDGRTGIASFHLDTLAQTGYETFPFSLATPHTAGASGEFLQAVDEDTGKLYFGFLALGLFGGVAVVDGPSLTLAHRFRREDAPPTPDVDPEDEGSLCTSVNYCVPTPAGLAPTLRGIEITPSTLTGTSAKVLLLMQEPKPPGTESNFNVAWIAQWDTETGTQDWIYRIAACGNFQFPSHPLSRYGLGLFQSRRGAAIYVACRGSGGTGTVVRLLTGDGGQPVVEEVFPGPLSVADTFSDPASDRMLLRILNEEGESWWVFDGPSSAYVGVVGLTLAPTGTISGLDRTTGRLYTLAPPTSAGRQEDGGGLLLGDIRRSPVPQALAFPQHHGSGVLRIEVDTETDGKPTRVFVRRDNDLEFVVYHDLVEVSDDPPVADQDRFTAGITEAPGVTGANFTGTGHGYGLRALLVGGLEAVPPAGPSVGSLRPGRSGPAALGSPCTAYDREIVFGYVRQAALSNNLAAASASSIEADPGTKTDLAEIVSRCWPRPRQPGPDGADPLEPVWPRPDVDLDEDGSNDLDELLGQPWPTEAAECSNDAEASSDTQHLPGYHATVSCRQSEDPAVVLAMGRSANLELGAVKVTESTAQVLLRRDPQRGLVIRSESWVRGVEVEGAFTMEAAGVIAESFAGGRPGTAGTSFRRILCGIRAPGQGSVLGDGGDHVAPRRQRDVEEDACIVKENSATPTVESLLGQDPVETTLNRAMAGRGRVSFPHPDPELSRGTPGGYLASIQKDRGQEISARAINNDSSTQVPAIEIVVYNDDQTLGRGRQIYQLAGVDASATYGIYLLDALGLLDFDVDLFPDIALPELLSEIVHGPYPPASALRAPDPSGALGNAITRALERFAWGVGFLLRNPREAALATLTWLFLAAPVYLALRRRVWLAGIG